MEIALPESLSDIDLEFVLPLTHAGATESATVTAAPSRW